jgi:CDP-paratose 2-epimerase
MKILITGGCGFVGSNLALFLKKKGFTVHTLDNLTRKGSTYNSNLLKKQKIKNYKINISNIKKIKSLPKYDLILDCCAEAAVEISKNDFDKVINTNLIGTINILKKSKNDKSKIIFISSSRIYPLEEMKKVVKNKNLKSKIKISKMFSEKDKIIGPKTIYGLTKLCSEMLIEEFSYEYKLKYLINRCGVISGPLQFGKQDQGFVSLWIWRHLNKKKLSYIGYGGYGNQIRDVLHIDDLCELILLQIKNINKINNKLFTVGGSKTSYTSLSQLTKLCQKITGNKIKMGKVSKTSSYDIPYYLSDNTHVSNTYRWKPKRNINQVVMDTFLWLKKNKRIIKKYF